MRLTCLMPSLRFATGEYAELVLLWAWSPRRCVRIDWVRPYTPQETNQCTYFLPATHTSRSLPEQVGDGRQLLRKDPILYKRVLSSINAWPRTDRSRAIASCCFFTQNQYRALLQATNTPTLRSAYQPKAFLQRSGHLLQSSLLLLANEG